MEEIKPVELPLLAIRSAEIWYFGIHFVILKLPDEIELKSTGFLTERKDFYSLFSLAMLSIKIWEKKCKIKHVLKRNRWRGVKRSLFKVSSKVSEALNPSRRNNKLIITTDYEFKGTTNRSRLLETYTRDKRLPLVKIFQFLPGDSLRVKDASQLFLRNGKKENSTRSIWYRDLNSGSSWYFRVLFVSEMSKRYSH